MMKAYIYLNWDKESNSRTLLLKRAMIQEVTDNIFQLGQNGFLFFTDKNHEELREIIKEKKSSKFMLIDVNHGINKNIIKTNIDLKGLLGRLYKSETIQEGTYDMDQILDKIFVNGYESLSKEETRFLDQKSKMMK